MKLLLGLVFFLSGVWGSADEVGEVDPLTSIAQQVLGKNGGDRLFYFPTANAPDTPAKYGVQFEDVFFQSQDGTKLHGWFMKPAAGTVAKGTIVFHHGNAGSVGHHLPFVLWMVKAGYQVLLYDYRGYGRSEGKVGRQGMVEDVWAAFAYVKTRKDVDGGKLVSFGHSLGAAKSMAALGKKAVPGVRAVVGFAGFASYRDMARRFAGDVGGNLVTDDWSPQDWVGGISPTPVLIAHGTADVTVPVEQGVVLFQKAKEPKTFFKIPEGTHGQALFMNNEEYRKKILSWLEPLMAG